jgi:hypothetical protein
MAEKEKIKQDNQNKMAELRNQQQAEKLQLTERHKKDTEVVKQQVAQKAQKAKQGQKATGEKKKKDGESK